MNASLGAHELKIFARIIRFMAKIDGHLNFDPQKKELRVKVLSGSKTCFSIVTFNESFFLRYELSVDEDISARIATRPILHVLRNIKTVVNSTLRLDPTKDVLFVDMLKPKDVRFQTSITLDDREEIENGVDLPESYSTIICSAIILNNLLNNFPKNLRDLALYITKERFEIRNHINHPDKDVQTIRLKYQLDPDEFLTYDVDTDQRLIVFSKDFLPLVEIAESTGSDIKIVFTENSSPIFVTVAIDPNVNLEVVMSTMREDILKTTRNPPIQTSYKEVMDGYLQQHQKVKDPNLTIQAKKISDAELHKIRSPSIGSFGSAKVSEGQVTTTTNPSPRLKRKSCEIMDIEEESDSSCVPSGAATTSKKPKSNQTLSQREQEEVSQLMLDLENESFGADDDDCEMLAQKPVVEISQAPSKLLEGLKKFQMRRRGSTVTAPRSLTPASENCFESQQCSNGSIRLDVSMAKFTTEEEVPAQVRRDLRSGRLEVYPNGDENMSSQSEQEIRSDPYEKHEKMRKVHYTKKLFQTIVKGEGGPPEPKVLTQGYKSDSDNSEMDFNMTD